MRFRCNRERVCPPCTSASIRDAACRRTAGGAGRARARARDRDRRGARRLRSRETISRGNDRSGDVGRDGASRARARETRGMENEQRDGQTVGSFGGDFDGTHLFRLGLRRGLGRARLRRRSRSRNRARPRRWESPRPAGETRTPPREPPTREARRRGGEMSMRTPSRFARARVRKRERGRPRPRAREDHRMPHARLCARSDVVARGRTRADGWSRKRAP